MGPAIETFLTAFLFGLVVLIILGAATRPIRGRIYRYFARWRECDLQFEQELKADQERRKQAEKELRAFCNEDDEHREADAGLQTRNADPVADVESVPGPGQTTKHAESCHMTRHAQEDAPGAAQVEVRIGQ
jgi:hypothetical protein